MDVKLKEIKSFKVKYEFYGVFDISMETEEYNYSKHTAYTFSKSRNNMIYTTPLRRLVKIYIERDPTMNTHVDDIDDLGDFIKEKLINMKVTVETDDGCYFLQSKKFNVGDNSIRFVLEN